MHPDFINFYTMKKILLFVALFCGIASYAQDYTQHNKGKIFVFWGGNRGYYTNSDITFRGNDYNFTLSDVEAVDKPKGWHIDYINPLRMTIPQTNFRLGYYLGENWTLSAGVDHMKYVMVQDQTVPIEGYVSAGTSHDKVYHNESKKLTEDFLTFEHTDGLNYVLVEGARIDDISSLFGIRNTDIFQVNLTEGAGFGVVYPKTNTKILNRERYDEFHVAGVGMHAKAGLHLFLFKHFMLVGELRGGYLNMHDVRTTLSKSDRAHHDFFFFETMLSVGWIFRL